MKTITREELKRRKDSGDDIKIVEVLAPEYFKKAHLPGAVNVPVNDDFEKHIQEAVPDKSRPVVVYCANKECPASPKAAQKMETLGYTEVYDYEEGKEDWQKAGLPVEK
jgi:rhodanese-related sulfurtransferase